MAFNYTKGEQIIGDLKGSDDSDKNTKIDFEEDEIKLVTGGTERVSISNSGLHVTGTADFQNPSGTEVIRISKSDDDFREIVFENDGTDIGGIYFNSAEVMFIQQANSTNDLALRVGSTNALRVKGATSRIGIFEDSPMTTLDVNGTLRVQGDGIQIATSKTPASSTDTGQAGQIAWDSSYLYICVATNTWKRVALVNW